MEIAIAAHRHARHRFSAAGDDHVRGAERDRAGGDVHRRLGGAAFAVDGHARVWRSQDAGDHWEPLGDGSLPDDYFVAVMRDAMCVDTNEVAGLYFGGRNGAVWASPDEGQTWHEIQKDLPDVMVVRAAVI